MKFSGNVDNGTRKCQLDFGGDRDFHLDPGIFKGFFNHCTRELYCSCIDLDFFLLSSGNESRKQ